MWHPDEGLIHSWLDGGTSEQEARSVDEHLAHCESCRALVAEARGLVAGASRIIGALDDVPGDVIPEPVYSGAAAASAQSDVTPTRGAGGTEARRTTSATRFWMKPAFRMAAGLALIAGVSSVVVRDQMTSGEKDLGTTVQLPVSPSVASDSSRGVSAAKTATPEPGTIAAAPGVAEPRQRDAFTNRANQEKQQAVGSLAQSKVAPGVLKSTQVASPPAANTVASVTDSGRGSRSEIVARAAGAASPTVQGGRATPTLTDLSGKVSGLQLQSRLAEATVPPTKLEKLAPVIPSDIRGREEAVRAEQLSVGCYVLTPSSLVADANQSELLTALAGVIELEGEPVATTSLAAGVSDSTTQARVTPPVQQGQQGQSQTQGVGQQQTQTGSAAGGRGGGGGGGSRGAGRGGGGGGRGGAAAAARAPTLPARALGWRVISRDSVEVRVVIDTTYVAMRLARTSDSTMVGIARLTSDSTMVGTIVASKAQCERP